MTNPDVKLIEFQVAMKVLELKQEEVKRTHIICKEDASLEEKAHAYWIFSRTIDELQKGMYCDKCHDLTPKCEYYGCGK